MAARSVTLEKLTDHLAYSQPPSKEGGHSVTFAEGKPATAASSLPIQAMSTQLPTIWLGGQNGTLYIHSGIAQWSHCIATVHLADSILQITHFRGRVFVALANGQCCIFTRSKQTGKPMLLEGFLSFVILFCYALIGEWDFDDYFTLDIGIYSVMSANQSSSDSKPNAAPCQTAFYSIRCLEVCKDTIWLGYRNMIFIVNTLTLKVIHSFIAHPRKETYVRQLTALGDGVWCCFRLDSTLRLYSAFKPYQHVQNVDIEPYVSKMVTPKSFNFVRVTALKASNQRLWIGTSNGVILCLPCIKPESESSDLKQGSSSSSVAVSKQRLTTSPSTGSLTLGTFMPLCDVSTIQLSFHGHKDNVKFFICTNNLILSGGEGYIDFRISDTEDTTSLSRGDRSHLVVWEITS